MRVAVPMLAVLLLCGCETHPLAIQEPHAGLTTAQARERFGPPSSIDLHTFGSTRVEHWVYDYVGHSIGSGIPMQRVHLLFRDGILESTHRYDR